MDKNKPLDPLKEKHKELLLAELTGWLHDWRKCTDVHIKSNSKENEPKCQSNYECQQDKMKEIFQNINISFFGTDLIDVIEVIKNYQNNDVLKRCHHVAHVEKDTEENDNKRKQYKDNMLVSSPFGFEKNEPVNELTETFDNLLDNKDKICESGNKDNLTLMRNPASGYKDYCDLQSNINTAFNKALGDTRRPVNEVTLWDWSHTVGALFKTAFAGAILKGENYLSKPEALEWRLLSIRFDGSGFTDRVVKIPDLLARRELLENGLDKVKKLLEFEIPLGSEVYRDENGSIFVVPDIANITDYTCTCGEDKIILEKLIQDRFNKATLKNNSTLGINGELIPKLTLDSQPWKGESNSDKEVNIGLSIDRIVPPIAKHLDTLPVNVADHTKAENAWKGHKNVDVCPVCGFRPQGPGEKAKRRKVCVPCEERRADRSKQWTGNLTTTIWIDEVSDINGRLALVTANLGIDDWLKPDGMVNTIFAYPPPKKDSVKENWHTKNPSFARLRRICETARTFWKEVESDINELLAISGTRLEIVPAGASSIDLGEYHAYELVLKNNVRLGVVWDGRKFITADNLKRVMLLLGEKDKIKDIFDKRKKEKPEDQIKRIAGYFKNKFESDTIIEEPTGYGAKNRSLGTFIGSNIKVSESNYAPVIPIMSEPRTFMMLVPADKALEVIGKIRSKYETEMAKVRNRLPLKLGVVFAGARTPLRAILDAGRRMLSHPLKREEWKLAVDALCCSDYAILVFKNGITWKVPVKMGDGSTEDEWYPYFEVMGHPVGRSRIYKTTGNIWLVHASELKKGDNILVSPSTFDFEFLDTSARRFEIVYDSDSTQRMGAKSTRPYYLEELDDFAGIWDILKKGLSTSQIKNIEGLLYAKKQEWKTDSSNDNFEQFVIDVICNAEWEKGVPAGLKRLCMAASTEKLADIIEFYMSILKEKSTVKDGG